METQVILNPGEAPAQPYQAPEKPKAPRRKPGPAVGKTVYTRVSRYLRDGELPEFLAWKIVRDMPTYVDVESLDPRCAAWKRYQRFSKQDYNVRLYDSVKAGYEDAIRGAESDVKREREDLVRARRDLAKAIQTRKLLRAAVRGAK